MSVLSRIAHDWAVRSFGSDHVVNNGIRALRTAEEAIELAQAYDVPKETMLKCVEMVYSKPKGEPLQELGGVFVTANILAESLRVESDTVFETELRRVLAKPPKHWGDRNQAKLDVGMTVESPVIPGGLCNLGTADFSQRHLDALGVTQADLDAATPLPPLGDSRITREPDLR